MAAQKKSKAGRPRIITEVIERKLEIALQNGLNITQACLECAISRDAFYDRTKIDPKFSDKMEKAQQFTAMLARRNITQGINKGDTDLSKWYVERRDKEFKPKSDITTNDKPITTSLVEFVGEDESKDSKD